MVSPLQSSFAKTLGNAMASFFLDATLTRDVQGVGSDPADPPAPTQETYSCKAIEENYSAGLYADGLVDASDVSILILANSLSVDPQPLDRITIRDRTLTVVPAGTAGMKAIQSDPARATWSCRCRA